MPVGWILFLGRRRIADNCREFFSYVETDAQHNLANYSIPAEHVLRARLVASSSLISSARPQLISKRVAALATFVCLAATIGIATHSPGNQ